MLISGLRYEIKDIKRRDWRETNPFTMVRLLRGEPNLSLTHPMSEWYITVRRYDEDFDRVLVMTKNEFRKYFPNKV